MGAQNVRLKEAKNGLAAKHCAISKDMERLKKMYSDKFEALKLSENSLRCKIRELELESERFAEMAKRKEIDLAQHTKLWQTERQNTQKYVEELNKNDDEKNLALIRSEERVLRQNEELEKMSESLKQQQIVSSEKMKALQTKLVQNESLYAETLKNYKTELAKLEALYTDSQEKSKEIVQRHEALSKKWKEENRKSFENFSNLLCSLKAENKSVIETNIALQSQMHAVINGKLKDTLSNNQQMQKKLAEAEQNIVCLNEKANNLCAMNEKYQKKEVVLLEEVKTLRNRLNKSAICVQRLQRKQNFEQQIYNCRLLNCS